MAHDFDFSHINLMIGEEEIIWLTLMLFWFPVMFNVYTREAGGGKLSISLEGPSKAHLDVVDRGHGYTTVAYNVTKEGK